MGSDRPKGPDNYHFEGYGPEMVEFNLRKLHDYEAICVRERKEKRSGVINVWPLLLYEKGLDFIEAARSEEVWNKAIEQAEGRSISPALKEVRRIFSEIESKVI